MSDGVASCQQCDQHAGAPAAATDFGAQVYLTNEQYRTLLAKLDTSNTYLKSIKGSVGFLAFVTFLGLLLGFLVGVGAIGG